MGQRAFEFVSFIRGCTAVEKEAAPRWEKGLLKSWATFDDTKKRQVLDFLIKRIRLATRPIQNNQTVVPRTFSTVRSSFIPSLLELAKEEPGKVSEKDLRRLLLGVRRTSQSFNPDPDNLFTIAEANKAAVGIGRGNPQRALQIKKLILSAGHNPADLRSNARLSADFSPRGGVSKGVVPGENISGKYFMEDVLRGRSVGAREHPGLNYVWWNAKGPNEQPHLHSAMVSRYGGFAPFFGDVPAITTAKINTANTIGYGGAQSNSRMGDFSQMLAGPSALTEASTVALPRVTLAEFSPSPDDFIRHADLTDLSRRMRISTKLQELFVKKFGLDPRQLGTIAQEDLARRSAIPALNERLIV